MIAIIVPAHNESQHIARCLSSLHAAACTAARSAEGPSESVRIFVVADACSDDTAQAAQRWGATVLSCQARPTSESVVVSFDER